jgi:hypothetical protein
MGRNYITGDWITAATESHHGIALGYYVDCDTALCLDCLPGPAGKWAAGDYVGWPGFESWESPAAIFMDSESDSVTHCGACGRVLRHDLTTEGYASITDSLERALESGDIGSAIEQWMDAYGDDVDLPAGYLGTFTQHYAMTTLWANGRVQPGENDDAYDTPIDPNWWLDGSDDEWAVSAFAPEDQASIREDCAAFIRDNLLDLAQLPPSYGSHPDAGSNAAAAGHDFALTRNRHGAGFWDRGLGDLGDRLTKAAHAYGESTAWCHADDDPENDHLAHLD